MHLYKFGGITMSKILPALAIFLLLVPLQASSFKAGSILRHVDNLIGHMVPLDLDIETLSKMARMYGTSKVTEMIGSYPKRTQEAIMLKIAVRKNVLSNEEANGLFSRLSGVEGFHKTLSKMIGRNESLTRGSLNELRIADRSNRHGFSINAIGKNFESPNKKNTTDIDVVLEKNGKTFAVEAKDYSPATLPTQKQFTDKMETLVSYCQSQRAPSECFPVVSITGKPTKWLLDETHKRSIRLINGPPDYQVEQLKALARRSRIEV